MFKDKLKELRRINNIKQEELASLLNVTPSSISNWENGISEPNIENITKLADYFNVSVDSLLCFTKKDYNEMDHLIKALKNAGMMVGEDLTEEELKKALKIVEILKEEKKWKNYLYLWYHYYL